MSYFYRLVEPYYHSTIFWASPSPQFPVFFLNFQPKAENSNRTPSLDLSVAKMKKKTSLRLKIQIGHGKSGGGSAKKIV